MKSKFRIALVCVLMFMMCVETMAYAASKNHFVWDIYNKKKASIVAIEDELPAASGNSNNEIVLIMTATSDNYGQFNVKLQRRDFWGRWHNVSHLYRCEHTPNSRQSKLFWSYDAAGRYRVVFDSPNTAQSITFTNVVFYRR